MPSASCQPRAWTLPAVCWASPHGCSYWQHHQLQHSSTTTNTLALHLGGLSSSLQSFSWCLLWYIAFMIICKYTEWEFHGQIYSVPEEISVNGQLKYGFWKRFCCLKRVIQGHIMCITEDNHHYIYARLLFQWNLTKISVQSSIELSSSSCWICKLVKLILLKLRSAS